MKAEMPCDGLVVTLFGYAMCRNETKHTVDDPVEYDGRPRRPPHHKKYYCDLCFAAQPSDRRNQTDEERNGEARRARREAREHPDMPYYQQFIKNLGDLGLGEGPEWP